MAHICIRGFDLLIFLLFYFFKKKPGYLDLQCALTYPTIQRQRKRNRVMWRRSWKETHRNVKYFLVIDFIIQFLKPKLTMFKTSSDSAAFFAKSTSLHFSSGISKHVQKFPLRFSMLVICAKHLVLFSESHMRCTMFKSNHRSSWFHIH